MSRYAVIAGGGTAGHVSPGLAVANALVNEGHAPDEILFVGTERGIENELVPAAGFERCLRRRRPAPQDPDRRPRTERGPGRGQQVGRSMGQTLRRLVLGHRPSPNRSDRQPGEARDPGGRDDGSQRGPTQVGCSR